MANALTVYKAASTPGALCTGMKENFSPGFLPRYEGILPLQVRKIFRLVRQMKTIFRSYVKGHSSKINQI